MVLHARHPKITNLQAWKKHGLLGDKQKLTSSKFYRLLLKDSSKMHLNNPIFINQKIRSLQISMHNDRVACVQVIHSFGLQEVETLAKRKLKLTTNPGGGVQHPINTTSSAIRIRFFSSIWIFGRCSSLYKPPLHQNYSYQIHFRRENKIDILLSNKCDMLPSISASMAIELGGISDEIRVSRTF